MSILGVRGAHHEDCGHTDSGKKLKTQGDGPSAADPLNIQIHNSNMPRHAGQAAPCETSCEHWLDNNGNSWYNIRALPLG